MDLDSSEENYSGGIECDQSLLQQFSSMGTTDREELISQLQKILGARINYGTATFFLDMNNWNLQGAIGSYFDVENTVKLPSAAIVFNSTDEVMKPNTYFRKTWTLINNGKNEWPMGCYLHCTGDSLLEARRQPVPCLNPGDSVEISIDFTSPPQPGTFQSKCRLCTAAGSYFGDPLWMIITVVEEETMVLTD